MEGQGRNHHYFEELLNASTFSDYSMASDYGQLNGYFAAAAAANQRMSDPGYFAAATNHRGFSNYPQSEISSSYLPVANNNYDTSSFLDNNNLNPLESEFNRLGLSSPTTQYQQHQHQPRRMRAPPSSPAPRNLNLLYMDPNLYTSTNLNLSSYAYNYGRPTAAADYRPPRVDDYRSDYEIGPWKSRPASTNGLVGSQSSLSSSSSLRRPIFSSLTELRGKIALAAKDQIGCRFLQSKFEEGDPEDIDLIFSEVKESICELMVDQFGNYLVQKFFKVCDEEQRTELLCLLISDERKFKDICTDMHGTRAVQKLLEHLTTPEQRSLVVSVLRRITLALIKNNNGQHVIQYCLKNFSCEDTKHILNVVADNCLEIATDKSGCCVLQQCLTDSVGESRDRLIGKITSNALSLSEHPYGNYVVQYILGLKVGQVTADIMEQLRGNYVSLSMNKYGSNVVEKFLKQAEGDEAHPIVEELIRSPNFLRVLQDPYGNYVAQSALTASRGPAHQAMSRLVNANYPFLHSHPHGKRVLARTKGFKTRP